MAEAVHKASPAHTQKASQDEITPGQKEPATVPDETNPVTAKQTAKQLLKMKRPAAGAILEDESDDDEGKDTAKHTALRTKREGLAKQKKANSQGHQQR